MRYLVFVFTILICNVIYSQENNIFHDRDFWKTNPTIAAIDKKIAEGHNIAALNSYAFDAVVYALLEKTDNKTIQYILSKPGNDVNKKNTRWQNIYFLGCL